MTILRRFKCCYFFHGLLTGYMNTVDSVIKIKMMCKNFSHCQIWLNISNINGVGLETFNIIICWIKMKFSYHSDTLNLLWGIFWVRLWIKHLQDYCWRFWTLSDIKTKEGVLVDLHYKKLLDDEFDCFLHDKRKVSLECYDL